jgi:hypothetical protein
MEFVPLVAMAALTLKLVDFARYARAGDINGIVTQLASWIASVLIVFLVAQTAWADGINVGDQNLAKLNGWSLLFWGLAAGSTASFVKDTLKAFDGTNSAAIPTLLPHPTRHQSGITREVG